MAFCAAELEPGAWRAALRPTTWKAEEHLHATPLRTADPGGHRCGRLGGMRRLRQAVVRRPNASTTRLRASARHPRDDRRDADRQSHGRWPHHLREPLHGTSREVNREVRAAELRGRSEAEAVLAE